MKERPPLVRDATDEGQQGNAELLIRQQERVEVDDLRWLLRHKEGRRVAWRLLERCGVHESVIPGYDQPDNPQRVYYNAGKQDLGHWLEAEIIGASEDAYLRMQLEAMQRAKKFDATVDAGHAESSSDDVVMVGMDGQQVESTVEHDMT